MINSQLIEQAYAIAKERYAELGIATDEVIQKLEKIQISLHCWQGDDVGGFEKPDAKLDAAAWLVPLVMKKSITKFPKKLAN
jgi:L-rhamnose isomerase